MPILCLGVSHLTAPIELRERLDFSAMALNVALARFGSVDIGPSEFAILSTCNRIELYAVVPPETEQQTDPFAFLIDFLAQTRGIPAAEFEPHLYRHTELEAVAHLGRVATGLDSLILGEPQILGQVAGASEAAVQAGTVGPTLSALFRTAIRAGKRARTETAISRNPASISSVAVRLAEQIVGELTNRHVLVIGAGEVGELAVEALRARGVQQVTVVNRTYLRAVELAERWGGRTVSYECLTEAVQAADIVITSTGAPHFILNPEIVRQAMVNRDRPLAVIDIAMPRDVDPAVGQIPGVHLFDLDDLRNGLAGGLAERQSEVPQVEAIVAEEVSAFANWLQELDILPVITDLRLKAEDIRQRELARALRGLPDLDPQVRAHFEHLSESLINKLLHEPMLRLRAEASSGHTLEYAQTVRSLFGLAAAPTPVASPIDPDR